MTVTLVAAICATLATSHAAIHVVNNNESFPADFRTFQEAHDAAMPGDTIVLVPTDRQYSPTTTITISKRLIVRGGVNLDSKTPSRISSMTLFSGAQGSIIEGLHIEGGSLALIAANITVRRCRIRDDLIIRRDSCLIESCFFQNLIQDGAISTDPDPVGTVIRNCSIRISSSGSVIRGGANIDHCLIVHFNTLSFSNFLSFATGSVRNSIVDFGTGNTFSSLAFDHCLFLDGSPERGTSAISSTYEDTFVLYAETPEGFPPYEFTRQWELKSTSPARTGDSDSGQQGLFGGSTPFVHGFHPAVPRVTRLTQLSANPTNGITFEVQAQTQE